MATASSSVLIPSSTRSQAIFKAAMAFGNMGDDCGTGVAFTRDPATGEKKLMGEFLKNDTILPQAAPGEAPNAFATGVAAFNAAASNCG